VPTKAARHKSRAAFLFRPFIGSNAMVRRLKSVPMETQPVDRTTEAATPMARAPSKRSQVTGTASSPMPRNQAETARKRSLKKQRSLLHD
jgi:hypothetical protein